MGSGNSSFDKRIELQEKFVRESLPMARERLGKKYSDRQIQGKLRQEYHGAGYGDGYVLQSDWRKVQQRLVKG